MEDEMGLTDVAGIFSRYFVMGFFLPVFFPLVLVGQIADESSTPAVYRNASGGTRLLILGGVALLAALLLSSLHYHVVRLLEGYPIRRLEDIEASGRARPLRRLLRDVPKRMSARWILAFQERTEKLDGPRSPARSRAARELNKYFPWRLQAVLPTRLGNAIRSFETHSNKRYGLDGVTAWPRIEMLLEEEEREIIVEAQSQFALFVNLTVLPGLFGIYVLVDLVINPPASLLVEATLIVVVLGAVFALTCGFYQAAVGAAVRWGMPVRAAFDLHRLDLYAKLGLTRPASADAESDIARAATRLMLYGEPFSDEVRSTKPEEEQ
jgi:hypothetical protein